MKGTRKLSRTAIKESFDNLPSGVCFANQSGIIILCNRQMHRLCHTLMGKDLQQIFELQEALEAPQTTVSLLNAKPRVYLFPNGTAWQFKECSITTKDNVIYTQIQAINVTELYKKMAELERENASLAEANARAKSLYSELDQLMRERETLNMKLHVHDELGLSLIAAGKLLDCSETSLSDYRHAGELWAGISRNLGIAERSSFANDSLPVPGTALANLFDAAAGIGVKIILDGNIPEDDSTAYLLTVALRECVTNIVYHAGGDTLKAVLGETPESFTAVIENNGDPPSHAVKEGGGLSGLRRKIEGANGVMLIESSPVFRLSLSFPKKGET